MIDINKKYRTRDGHEVRIYATDGEHGELVHGAIKHKQHGWQSKIWFADGQYYGDESNPFDLIEVRPRHKRTVWLHVFKNGSVCATEGPDHVPAGRLACIKVDLDFEEGEGLNTSAKRVNKTGES
jgi:hypothetical protein